jgi:hypothetical protein
MASVAGFWCRFIGATLMATMANIFNAVFEGLFFK